MDVFKVFKRQLEVTKKVYDMDFIDLKSFGILLECGVNEQKRHKVRQFIKDLNKLDAIEVIRLANALNLELYGWYDEIRLTDFIDEYFGQAVYNFILKLDFELDEYYVDYGDTIKFYDAYDASKKARNIIKSIITDNTDFDGITSVMYDEGMLSCYMD